MNPKDSIRLVLLKQPGMNALLAALQGRPAGASRDSARRRGGAMADGGIGADIPAATTPERPASQGRPGRSAHE
jgi:hypothetical protein